MRISTDWTLRSKSEQGFTLVELLVVCLIIGILAGMVTYSYNPETSRNKSQAFNMLADFNFARSEAVNQNRNVRVDFFFDNDPDVDDRVNLDGDVDGTVDDGYRIWIDDDADGVYTGPWDVAVDDTNNDGYCSSGEGDCLLKAVAFTGDVRFYDLNATNGPLITPAGTAINFENGGGDDDGVSVNNDWLNFQPDGTTNVAGTIYIYVPDRTDPAVIEALPLAVVISSNTGRVRIMRWQTGTDTWETS